LLIEKDRPLSWFEKYVLVPFESIPLIGGALVFVGGFLFVLQATFRYGTKTFRYLGQVLGRTNAELVLVILVFVVAGIAYQLKQRRQGWYGLTETAFGAGSACTIAFSMVPGCSTLAQWVALFGCTYIIVRGVSNVIEAVDRYNIAWVADRLAALPPAPTDPSPSNAQSETKSVKS
jgi:hypothetical protein